MTTVLKVSDPPDIAVLDESVLDALGRLRGQLQPEFVNQVIAMFMESALTLLAELKRGLGQTDVTALYHASHSLKSCSATIGASSLAARCAELEAMARRGCVPDATARVEAIAEECQLVQAALICRLAQARNTRR